MTVKQLVESAKDNPVQFVCDECQSVFQGGHNLHNGKCLCDTCYNDATFAPPTLPKRTMPKLTISSGRSNEVRLYCQHKTSQYRISNISAATLLMQHPNAEILLRVSNYNVNELCAKLMELVLDLKDLAEKQIANAQRFL